MYARSIIRREKWGILAAIIAVVILGLLPTFIQSKYYISLFILCFIWGLFAMSLDLLVGYLGHVSLGHAAFFGAGAYTLAILEVRLGWDFISASAGALLFTTIIAAIFGLLVAHISGVQFMMVNLALAQILWGLAYRWNSMTGGDNGIRGISRPTIAGFTFSGSSYYYFALAVFVVCTLLLFLLVRSPFGLSLKGIKQTQSRMRVLGYNVWLHKYIAYVIAGSFAGIAGIMGASFNSFVGPGDVAILTSSKSLLMVLVGGAGTLFGPMLGAVIVVLTENLISAYTKRWLIILGLLYIVVVVFLPGGLIQLVHKGFAGKKAEKGGQIGYLGKVSESTGEKQTIGVAVEVIEPDKIKGFEGLAKRLIKK